MPPMLNFGIRIFRATGKDSPDRRLMFALAVGFAAYLVFGISRVGAAILVIKGNYLPIQFGLVMGLYSVAPLLIAVRVGSIASRFGPRRPMIFGVIVLLCGAVVQAASGPYFLIPIGALFVGVGFTVLQISLQLHIGESSEADVRVRSFSYFSMAQSAATSIAALLVGYLSESISLHAPLSINSGASLILLVIAIANRKLFRSSILDIENKSLQRGSLLLLIRQRNVGMVLAAGALLAMAWDLHSFVVPFISGEVGISPRQIGFILGIFSGATFFVRMLLSRLSSIVSSELVIKGGLLLVGLCFVAYPWHTSFATMAIFATVLGLCLGTAQPNLLALLHEVAAARDIGRLIGFRTVLVNLGSSLWPLCFSALGKDSVVFMLFGAGAIFFLYGVLFKLSRTPL